MNLSAKFLSPLIAVLICACGLTKKNSAETEVMAAGSGGLLKGYLQIDDETQPIEYELDGDDAIIFEHVRIPKEAILSAPPQGLNLTTDTKIQKWPKGIVPFKKDPVIHDRLINLAAAQFSKAGIRLVPHTNEEDWVELKVVNCVAFNKEGKCDKSVLGRADWGYRDKFRGKKQSQVLLLRETIDVRELFEPLPPNYRPSPDALEALQWLKRHALYILVHELGHVLGLRHEQAHPDARKYLVALTKDPKEDPFEDELVKYGRKKEALTPFDEVSIMIYYDAFQKKCLESGKKSCKPSDLVMPWQLSTRDVEGLKKFYAKEIAKRK